VNKEPTTLTPGLINNCTHGSPRNHAHGTHNCALASPRNYTHASPCNRDAHGSRLLLRLARERERRGAACSSERSRTGLQLAAQPASREDAASLLDTAGRKRQQLFFTDCGGLSIWRQICRFGAKMPVVRRAPDNPRRSCAGQARTRACHGISLRASARPPGSPLRHRWRGLS